MIGRSRKKSGRLILYNEREYIGQSVLCRRNDTMRLITWNVNGIRAVQKKGLEQILDYLDADIVCFQETKAQPDQIELNEDLYPVQIVNSAERKGYSGTMIASRMEPEEVHYGIGVDEFDHEGRVITARFAEFTLVNVYVPNSGDGLKRLEYRQKWDEAFSRYVKSIEGPVLLCGDLNVAPTALDYDPVYEGERSSGLTPEERCGYELGLGSFLQDAFRVLYPEERKYSWWSYYDRGRERGQGWRIDQWMVSDDLMVKVRDCRILDDVYGSDYCPVELDIDVHE